MTADRLPAFTPTEDYRTYRVTVMEDQWDSDRGKFSVTVHAIGPKGAREQAVEQVRDEFPDACAVHVEEIADDPAFHDECGFAWTVHDNTDPHTKGPFGCPTELTARLRWGR